MTKVNIVVEVQPDDPTEYKVGQVFRHTQVEDFYMLVRTSLNTTELICLEDGEPYHMKEGTEDLPITPTNTLTREQFDGLVDGDAKLFEPLQKGTDLRITPL